MDMFFSNNTLYVTLDENINTNSIERLKSRVFTILDDYYIENIVLNVMTSTNNNLLDEFVTEFNKKYPGTIKINSFKNY